MSEKEKVSSLFREWSGADPIETFSLPLSGSDRRYFRIVENSRSIIGVYNPVQEENYAFVGFTDHFSKLQLPVPEIYAYYPEKYIYFLQDLGETNLYSWLKRKDKLSPHDDEVSDLFTKIIDNLIIFQVDGIKGLDLELCYPHKSFDRQSMMWDLNYFKYMFLKLVAVPFNEKYLEKDFEVLTNWLLMADRDYFLYRDFQSANIMVINDEPWFIDYQGGRKGSPQYDLASLLYDSKAYIPHDLRDFLLEYYIEKFCTHTGKGENDFRAYYAAFCLIRIMQALGAYGFRGLYEQKPGFAHSILPAISDINNIIDSGTLEIELPELRRILGGLPGIDIEKKYRHN